MVKVISGMINSRFNFQHIRLIQVLLIVPAVLHSSSIDRNWRRWKGTWAKDYLEPQNYPIAFQIKKKDYFTPPIVERGSPAPGKRIKLQLQNYPNACYTLYLPKNYTNKKVWPLIIELPGSTGLCDATHLGYGISKGVNWIWASIPYVDKQGSIVKYFWGDDPLCTTRFLVAVLNNIKKNYPINTKKVVLAGFSSGAFAISGMGNWNEKISSNWAGFFAHSHFEGCCLSGGFPGSSSKRMERLRGKKILITTGNNDITARSGAHKCSYNAYKRLKENGFDVTYLEIPQTPPNDSHSRGWICENTKAAKKAREWLDSFID